MVELIRDKALSELIGFILLLALLILVASLYLTYVVPANGREAEIAHMDYIKGQFLNYKISTDALWINREGVTIAQAITLGTQGVKTTGVFAGFQLFSPVFSGGKLEISNKDPSERLTTMVTNPLYSPSFAIGNPDTYTPLVINETVFSREGNMTMDQAPDHWYLNFSTDLTTHRDSPVYVQYPAGFPSEYGTTLTGSYSDYSIKLKALPRYLTQDFNWTYGWRNGTNEFLTPDKNSYYWIRYQTDLLLTITKKNLNVLDNYPVYSNIKNSTERIQNYTIDILNPAYGFSQETNDFSNINTAKYTLNSSSSDVSNFMVGSSAVAGYVNVTNDPSTLVTLHPVSDSVPDTRNRLMGRLKYYSHNVYYRTQENFIFQMGGIFVNQTDGSSPLNLPLISVKKPDTGTDALNVNITDISLSGGTSVSGSSPVQIQTTLDKIRYSALDPSQQNVASVVLRVDNTNHADLWRLIFSAIKKNAGYEAEQWINVSETNPPTLTINEAIQ